MNSAVEVLRRSLESGDFGRCESELEALARIERLVELVPAMLDASDAEERMAARGPLRKALAAVLGEK